MDDKGGKVQARLTLLGGFALHDAAGAARDVPGAKARALLALVALAPGSELTQVRLASLLWGDRAEPQARDSLKHTLADLRRFLASIDVPALHVEHGAVRLDLDVVAVDVREFETLASSPVRLDLFHGLELFEGDLLDGITVRDAAFEDWLRQERQRLRTLAETVAAQLLAAAEQSGDTDEIAAAALRLQHLDPLREEASRALMRVHSARGERSAALRIYAELHQRLRQDLQIEPESDTKDLERAIRLGTAPGGGGPETAAPAAAGNASAPIRPERPSIAVLPFQNLSGDPEQEYFGDGIAEDIITALSHLRWFTVIGRNSSFAYRDRTPGLKEIARELGVRYILDGSVRKIGSRVRLTGELIEPETGIHVWGERYDRELADIFAIQDDLTRRLVGAIEPEILRGESQRALSKPAINPDAYDCHMRGVWHHNLQGGPEDFEQAIHWQRRAIALDPGLARAYMILSRSIYARCLYGYSVDLDGDRKDLLEAATRAVELEDRDAYAHYAMCCAHMLHLQPGAAVVDAERAVELAPSLALAQNGLGWARIFTGRFAEAVEPIETAMRLSPRDPITYFFNSRLGLAHYHLGDYEAAVLYSRRSLYSRPRYFNMLVLLAALGQLGRKEEFQTLIHETRANRPHDADRFWTYIFPYADPADRAFMEDGLRKAGL